MTFENYYTVGQLFEFMDVSTDGIDIYVNNVKTTIEDKVYENFKVRYSEANYLANDEDEEEQIPAAQTENAVESAVENNAVTEEVQQENPVPVNKSIVVNINGSNVVLSGKPGYTFVDIFDFYPFDLTKAAGSELITTVNGANADA